MALSHQRKISACVLALYWPALFILAHIPIPRVVQEANVSDKSLHFLAYLILTFLLWSVINGNKKVNWRRAAPWLVLFVIVLYGILDEWLQSYVAGRSTDIRDLYADLAGSITGLILCSFFTFWPAGLFVMVIFIFGVTNVTRANLADLMPVSNAVFHVLAYAILTYLWIQCLNLFLAVKAHKTKRFILSFAGPAGFLIIVKFFSVIAGKDLALMDIIISFGAIVTVLVGFYVWRTE